MCIVFIPYFALTFLKVPPRSASVPKPIIPKPTPTLQPRTVPQRIAHQPTPRSTPQTTTRSTPQVTQRSTPQSTPKQTTPQLAPKRTSPAKQPTISTAKQPVRAISASAPTKATVKPTAKLVRKNIHRKVLRNYATTIQNSLCCDRNAESCECAFRATERNMLTHIFIFHSVIVNIMHVTVYDELVSKCFYSNEPMNQ